MSKKRVDDSSPSSSTAKVRKLEHTKDAEPSPIGFRRYYPFWVDKKGDESEEELVSNDEVDRLVKLLEEDPFKLNEVEQDQMCRFVDVDKIMTLALKWGEKMGMDDIWITFEFRKKCNWPDREVLDRIRKRMLRHPERLKETEMHLIYNHPIYEVALAEVLHLCKVNDMAKEGVNFDDWFFLCRSLPYKLFAHVFYEKMGVRLFVSDEEDGSDEANGSDEDPFISSLSPSPSLDLGIHHLHLDNIMKSEVGKKRVDDSSPSSSPAKVRKLEHTKDAEPSPISFRRYYPFWVDKKGDESEEELVSNEEVNRLVKLLEEDPFMLNEVEQDQLCRSVDVDKIMTLAWKWGEEMEMDDNRNALAFKTYLNCPGRHDKEVDRIHKSMLCHPEKLKETEMHLIYNHPIYEKALEEILLSGKVNEMVKEGVKLSGAELSYLDDLFFLSRCLPYKLFAHVFYEKTGIRLFVSGEEASSDEAASSDEYCPICCEKNSHLDCLCPYKKCVPLGAKVGPDYQLICQVCGCRNEKEACPICGLAGRRAVPKWCVVCRVRGECLKDDLKHRAFREKEAAELEQDKLDGNDPTDGDRRCSVCYVYLEQDELDEYDPTEGGRRCSMCYEYDPTEGGRMCSICYEDDHSAENCWDKSNYAV